MASSTTFVIVGGGLAGAKAVEALRDNDFDGQIILFADEKHLPYERPPLSKEYLAGKKSLAEFTVHDSDWYRDHDVDLRLEFAGGVAGSRRTHRRTRRRHDSALRQVAAGDRIGIAAPADTWIRPDRGLLSAQLRRRGGAEFRSDRRIFACSGGRRVDRPGGGRRRPAARCQRHRRRDPPNSRCWPHSGERSARCSPTCTASTEWNSGWTPQVEEIAVDDGAATGLKLADGSTVAADAVLVAVGAKPNIELAEQAGLAMADGGVLVDASLRTSDPDIYAVGDIAAAEHPLFGTRIRTEHWANALKQPAVAVAGMLGNPGEYAELPYFFTDQYDLGMEYVGHSPGFDRVVFRGDVAGREFVAFWLDGDDRVLAGMNVNIWDVLDEVKGLIRSQSPGRRRLPGRSAIAAAGRN